MHPVEAGPHPISSMASGSITCRLAASPPTAPGSRSRSSLTTLLAGRPGSGWPRGSSRRRRFGGGSSLSPGGSPVRLVSSRSTCRPAGPGPSASPPRSPGCGRSRSRPDAARPRRPLECLAPACLRAPPAAVFCPPHARTATVAPFQRQQLLPAPPKTTVSALHSPRDPGPSVDSGLHGGCSGVKISTDGAKRPEDPPSRRRDREVQRPGDLHHRQLAPDPQLDALPLVLAQRRERVPDPAVRLGRGPAEAGRFWRLSAGCGTARSIAAAARPERRRGDTPPATTIGSRPTAVASGATDGRPEARRRCPGSSPSPYARTGAVASSVRASCNKSPVAVTRASRAATYVRRDESPQRGGDCARDHRIAHSPSHRRQRVRICARAAASAPPVERGAPAFDDLAGLVRSVDAGIALDLT